MAELRPYEDLIEEISARLDLRDPNRDAVQSLANEVSQYYDVDEKQPPFEAVIDSATGVGKTYIITGSMEFFAAAYGIRDFVVVTPGTTILGKTRDNFTPGHPKSLLGPMSFRPVVITSDNFATPAMRAAMDDESQIKVYLFTVQSLIRPESKTGRKTHRFQEGLGTEFYAHLQQIPNLVVFADEHHCYYGPAFSKAVRDLDPWVLVGLTATPDKKTPKKEIIFRFPLAAAIAEHLVKTPVIVGRRDDRSDLLTKLTDGVVLLHAKEEALKTYVESHDLEQVNPVMLVVAKDTAEADEYGAILRSSEFFGGMYKDAVLVVHSKQPDDALAKLDDVEKPESPVRIIISVGMLKEGWDVKNVYVIASMRASVSEILTEQTLGRGMRLPFGSYTGIEILDTLEVVAHERYQQLLDKAGVLNEAFIDYRTRAVLRVNEQGEQVVEKETFGSGALPILPTDGEETTSPSGGSTTAVPFETGQTATAISSMEDRTAQIEKELANLKREIRPRDDAPIVLVPRLQMTALKSHFSLADITDVDGFRKLGAALAANPDGELNRMLVNARVVEGLDGVKRTETYRSQAEDHIHSVPTLFSLGDLRTQLAEMVLASSAVPARVEEVAAVEPLLDAFFDGLGPNAEEILSANIQRAGARLIRLVEDEQRAHMAEPSYDEVVNLVEFRPSRTTDKPPTDDRFGPFSSRVAYEGWKRSLFPTNWFDSSPERTVANAVDGDESVSCWVRLLNGDLPILWNDSQNYNPDLFVIETDGMHYLVEVKREKDMSTAEVLGKREAALRWANHVSASPKLDGVRWRYVLLSESDVLDAKGSWQAMKLLGG